MLNFNKLFSASSAKLGLSIALASSLSLPFNLANAETTETLREETLLKLWSPVIAITGAGDSNQAISQMNQMVQAQQNITDDVAIDDSTQAFIDDFWAMFEKFNLEKLYRLLPNEDGDWRKLNVYGYLDEQSYVLRATPMDNSSVDIGEMSAEFRSMPIKGGALGAKYLMETDILMNVGMSDWEQVTTAAQDTLRILSGDTELQLDQTYSATEIYSDEEKLLKHLKKAHPQLNEQDLKVLIPIWYAYPNLWSLLSSVSELDNLNITRDGQGIIHSNMVLKLKPKKIKKSYPSFGKYLSKMGQLFDLEIAVRGNKGRYLLSRINSEDLTLSLETYIKDGLLLAYDESTGKLIDNEFNQLENWQALATVDADLKILGVKTELTNIETQINYQVEAGNATLFTQTNQTPDLNLSGRALGVLPTNWVDALLPIDLENVISEFLDVFFHGSNGQGIVAGMEYTKASAANPSNVDIDASMVGLDNIFVRIGVGILNRKVIPSDKVSEDMRSLWKDTQQAFRKDLSRFSNLYISKEQSKQGSLDLTSEQNSSTPQNKSNKG